MATNEAQLDGMVTESWKLLHELLTTGQMTLKNKAVIKPSDELMVRTVQDIAKMRPPKIRKITNVDNFRLMKTVQKTGD